jgi:hypothetical protein
LKWNTLILFFVFHRTHLRSNSKKKRLWYKQNALFVALYSFQNEGGFVPSIHYQHKIRFQWQIASLKAQLDQSEQQLKEAQQQVH